jgi:hypothetical protein
MERVGSIQLFAPSSRRVARNKKANTNMRKQYHFRPSPNGLLAWDVDRLVKLSENLPIQDVPLESIKELDEPYWSNGDNKPTGRDFIEHVKLTREADLDYPIILSNDGRIMDGMHRVCKAMLEGNKTLKAVVFRECIEPDYVGKQPDELPY